MTYTYKYPRSSLTVDIAVFRNSNQGLDILLIKRKEAPFTGLWALPGGFVEMDETVEIAAERELFEETNLNGISLNQFQVFSEVDRDPRGRTVSVVFSGFLQTEKLVKAKDDAEDAKWYSLKQLPELAFDHAKIIKALSDKFANQA